MDPVLIDCLKTRRPTVGHAVRIEFPTFTLRLTDAANLTLNGEAFVGEDLTYGSLGPVSDFSDGESGEARTVTIVLQPPTEAAIADIIDPAAQFSRVTVWWFGLDPETGAAVGAPEDLCIGYVNTADVTAGGAQRLIELDIVQADDFVMDEREGQNLSPAFLRAIDPSAAGLDHATGVAARDYWGGSQPRSGVTNGAGGGGGRDRPTVVLV